MFQAESDDETTDGWCATHEEMEEAGGRKREDGSELEEWEGGVDTSRNNEVVFKTDINM